MFALIVCFILSALALYLSIKALFREESNTIMVDFMKDDLDEVISKIQEKFDGDTDTDK